MFSRILVATDGSEPAARAVAEAAELAQLGDAELTVMTVVPDPSPWLLGAGWGGYVPPDNLDEVTRAAEKQYGQMLDSAIDSVPSALGAKKLLVHGSPAEVIVEEANTGGYDLVVMGSRGRGEIKSLLLGSVSHNVVQASRVAVLIVHGAE